MTLDYFYGQSGELFSYFRIPKALFQDCRFRQLSTDARTLYGILLDRMSLSVKNGWLDEQGRVYIIYTVREVQESLCCAEHKAVKLFRELEGMDLIERKRRGLGRPSLIYVKDFSSGLPKAQVQNCPNSNSGAAESATLEQPKPQANKTDKNKTERNHPFLPDETDRLTSLVTDILDLSKLQSGVAELKYEKVNFSEHLGEIVPRFSLLNEIKDYNVVLNAEPDIFINADITKIDQVVYNFINNALTYTGDDKTVRVNLYHKTPTTARLEVCDSGIGIDPENLKYVWDRYYRVKKNGETHQRAKKGSGLGLSIVKGVLEMHRLNFGADSTVGVGSTFWFEFEDCNPNRVQVDEKKQKKQKVMYVM